MKKLQGLNIDSEAQKRKPIFMDPMSSDKLSLLGDNLRDEIEDIEDEMEEVGLLQRKDSAVTAAAAKMPGLVILNPGECSVCPLRSCHTPIANVKPGQLTYSHKLNQCMTLTTWLAREKAHAMGEHHEIDKRHWSVPHNSIPGHTNATEHVVAVFDSILPQLIKEDANIYVVAIADAAESFINYMDLRMRPDDNIKDETGYDSAADRVLAMAFMEPKHDPKKVQCPFFKLAMDKNARSWITSTKPKGYFLNCLNGAKPILRPDQVDDDDTGAELGESFEELPKLEDEQGTKYPVGLETEDPVVVERPGNVTPEGADVASDKTAETDEYDHTKNAVSCATYSAEVLDEELIWPNVMDLALEFFVRVAEEERTRGCGGLL